MSAEERRSALGAARLAAAGLRLPFERQAWQGPAGNWAGVGQGSSIDFHDHRPYLPGDDPRYLNMVAYARTGQMMMKLFQQETSPAVDLLVDDSASMSLGEGKARRTMELVLFAAESALQSACSVRIYFVGPDRVRQMEPRELLGLAGEWLRAPTGNSAAPDLHRIPIRGGSLRILISDLLFPGGAEAVLSLLADRRGAGVVFVPWLHEESNPDWHGNIEFEDCESRSVRKQRIDAELRRRYVSAYRAHFALWQSEARRRGVRWARVAAAGTLRDALRGEALQAGAVALR